MIVLLLRLILVGFDILLNLGFRSGGWREVKVSLFTQLRVLRGYFTLAVYTDVLTFILCCKYMPGFLSSALA